MVSDDDLVEIILETIKSSRTPNPDFRKSLEQTPVRKGKWGFHVTPLFNKPYTSLPARKLFLSEYEIKLLLKDGRKKLVVPESAILSPLAQEWLIEKGIQIIRE